MKSTYRVGAVHIALCVLGMVGCGPRVYPMARVMDGETHQGIFVSPYAYEHFMRAELAVAAGDDTGALREYALARTGPADDAFLIARLAATHLRLHQHGIVRRLLEEGSALDATSEPLALVAGDLALADQEWSRAVDHYERAHGHAPHSDAPIQRLAVLLDQTPFAVDALRRITDGSERPPALRARLAAAIHANDAEMAAQAALSLMRVAPVYATEIIATAEVQLADGRTHMAIRLLEHPAFSGQRALGLRVHAFVAAGQLHDARALLLTHSAGTLSERAGWWLLCGEAELALREAEQAMSNGDERARLTAARASLSLGHPAEAARTLSGIPDSSEHAEEARALMAEVLRAGGMGALGDELESGVDGSP